MARQPDLFPQQDFIEEENQGEGIDDLEIITPDKVSQAVVSATDWTTETVVSQINKGNIQLNPRFQRRDAWDSERKSRFIESLIIGLPIPQLVLAESKSKRGSYIVIDGKQRLLSIRQFASESVDDKFERLKLSGLTVRRDLSRLSLVDLKSRADLSGDLSSFENQPIRTVVVKNWGTEDFLYQVFLRLNTGSVPLSPQELRQALHPGPFVEYVDIESGQSHALREILKLKKPDFRMRDTELLVRFFAFRLFLGSYAGNLKAFLDLCCETLNENWEESKDEIIDLRNEFELAYLTSRQIFGDNAFRKWTNRGYEKQFNRAIFDILMYFFSYSEIRELAVQNAPAIEGAFKSLCQDCPEFLASIERTTKSIGATSTRLVMWGATISNILEVPIDNPMPWVS